MHLPPNNNSTPISKLNKYLFLRIELVSNLSELSATIVVVKRIIMGRRVVNGESGKEVIVVTIIVGKIKLGII